LNEQWVANLERLTRIDDIVVIPWAEGNGLWSTLTELVSDLAAADLVTFLIQNPSAYDSAAGLAVAIGRDAARIQPVLDGLADAGFLVRVELNGISAYHLTDEPHRRQTLQQYVTWLQEGYHWTRMAMDR
jgi:hypothetical protein